MTGKPIASDKEYCPFHRVKTSKVCHLCPLYVKVMGNNPQNGAVIDHWNCSLAWLPILLVENSQQVRQGAAATESFRNEVMKRAGAPRTPIANSPQQLIEQG